MLRERKQREEKKTVEKCFPFTHSPIPHKFSTLSAVFLIQNTFYNFFWGGKKNCSLCHHFFQNVIFYETEKIFLSVF